MNKTVIIVGGPTAAGKTAVAIALARHFHTSIISADSRQCYRELNIGVARPSSAELEAVPHYFIATHSIFEEINASGFEAYALQKTKELFQEHDVVIMVGGTGLYIRAFCEGLDTIPAIDPAVRQRVIENYRSQGLAWLQEEIKLRDPLFYNQGEVHNPQRMMRALEVIEATGSSILSYRKGEKADRNFRIIKTGLQLPKTSLESRINKRIDQMLSAGLVDEVKDLWPYRQLNALQTVGYSEIFSAIEGQISLDQAIDLVRIHTRQYAKRQMTWFRKEKEMEWFSPDDIETITGFLDKRLSI